MNFLYNKEKSESNKEKHGIDFIEAQVIWEDPQIMEFNLNFNRETRFQVIGRAYEKIWSSVITYRGDVTRLISVRRARQKEVQGYES